MGLKAGSLITNAQMEYDQNRIYNLRLFTKVQLSCIDIRDSLATILVSVNERWYIIPYVVLGYKHRDIKKLYYGLGVAHDNLRGQGEKLSLSFALGYVRWTNLAYYNPKLWGGDYLLRIFGNYSDQENLSLSQTYYREYHTSAGAMFGKRFGLYHLSTIWLHYNQWRLSSPAVGRTVSPSGKDEYLEGGISYLYDSRDLSEYTTKGSLLALSISKIGFGNTDIDLLRYSLDARHFIPLYNSSALGVRGFGTFTAGGIVPPYQYVYFGYQERIRGHNYEKVEGEDILGGSLEARIPILSPRYHRIKAFPLEEFNVWRYGVYFAAFADAGKAWFRSGSFKNTKWFTGAGAGIHILLPYSVVVRFEVAMNEKGNGELIFDLDAAF
jgi:outer membrane protein assembly factor BamA